MRISNEHSDEAILTELGARLTQRRIAQLLSQAALAAQAGVSKRTVERVEAGQSVQLVTLIRLCRVLGLLEGLNQWLPESAPSPMALLKEKQAGKGKQRARSHRTARTMKPGGKPWTWDDSSS